jgi:AGZA family xanthine/uracil permease-like MFS transporter
LIHTHAILGNLGMQADALRGDFAVTHQAVLLLGNGFIITSLVWAGTVAFIVDGALRRAAALMAIGAAASLFGVMHSPYENGRLFFPWSTDLSAPWLVSGAYAAVVGWLLLIAARPADRTTPPGGA